MAVPRLKIPTGDVNDSATVCRSHAPLPFKRWAQGAAKAHRLDVREGWHCEKCAAGRVVRVFECVVGPAHWHWAHSGWVREVTP